MYLHLKAANFRSKFWKKIIQLTNFNRSAVDEPVDTHARVADRLQTALEVNVCALDGLDVVQGSRELRRCHYDLVLSDCPAVARGVLQELDLLQRSLVLCLRQNVRVTDDLQKTKCTNKTANITNPNITQGFYYIFQIPICLKTIFLPLYWYVNMNGKIKTKLQYLNSKLIYKKYI